jgi:molybdate-binding protein
VNVEFVDTCTLYLVAPAAAVQVSVGVLLTLEALSEGETSVGTLTVVTGGGGTTAASVVKKNVADQRLVPLAFVALTLQ